MTEYKKSVWKMNRRLIGGSALALVAVAVGIGGTQVVPYISDRSLAAAIAVEAPTVNLGRANSTKKPGGRSIEL